MPENSSPPIGGQQPGQDVHGQQHLPHAHAGQPTGDRVVADGVDHPAQPRRPQAEHEHDGDDRPHDEVRGERAEQRARADVAHDVEDVGRPRQPAPQSDGDDAQQHARHAEGHDQWVHLEHADGEAVDDADGEPDAECDGQRGDRAPTALVGCDVGGEVGRHRDRQVDAARQHAQGLAGGEDRQRAGQQEDRPDAGDAEQAVVLPRRDRVEDGEDAGQHERRLLGEARAPARPRGLLGDRRRRPASTRPPSGRCSVGTVA